MKNTEKVERKSIGPNWSYYKLELKLQTDMLGTCCEASIYNEHVLQKAKKEIAKANKLTGKLEKSLQKYQGSDISFEKELLELKAVIRAYQAHVGRREELPDDIDELLEYAKELEAEYAELVSQGETAKATVFMKDKSNWPIISTHMVLGNIKENLKIITNNGDKSIVTSKVSCGEIGALDVKAVESFMRPDTDIKRDPKGKPVLEERPIMFERMGKKLTAIAQSEVLPAGAEMYCTLRVRKDSPLTQEALWKLLDLGKSNGLGTWRGSGNRGAFVFRLTYLPEFREPVPEGWN